MCKHEQPWTPWHKDLVNEYDSKFVLIITKPMIKTFSVTKSKPKPKNWSYEKTMEEISLGS